jgi:hypothetical protein
MPASAQLEAQPTLGEVYTLTNQPSGHSVLSVPPQRIFLMSAWARPVAYPDVPLAVSKVAAKYELVVLSKVPLARWQMAWRILDSENIFVAFLAWMQ